MDINRVPLGLLSLLDIQSQGSYPADLQATVQAGIDITHLYLAAKRQELVQVGGGVSTTLGGQSGFVVVPQGELWLVRMAHVDVVGLDSSQISNVGVSLRVLPTPGGTNFTLVATITSNIVQSASITASLPFDPYLILPAGFTVATYFDRYAVVPTTGVVITGQLLITRIAT